MLFTNLSFVIFQLQLSRVQYAPSMDWKDSASFVLPLVHAIPTNITQLVERRDPPPSPVLVAINEHLRRFFDFSAHNHNNGDCLMFAAVRDLLTNFVLPTDQPAQPNQQIPHQGMSPAPGQVGSSPSPMMHSPMPNMNQGGGQPQGYGMAPNQ